MKNIKRFNQIKLGTLGFTLVELLVVVLVISVLGGIVIGMLNSSGVRGKARDSQRISDLRKIQTALELYFADNRQYPPTSGPGNWNRVTGSDPMSSALTNNGYLNTVPTDPTPVGSNSGPCSGKTSYRYNYRSDGTYYILTAITEVETSDDSSKCINLNNWSSYGCSNGDTYSNVSTDVCYGVENP